MLFVIADLQGAMSLLILSLLTLTSAAETSESPVTCFSNNTACDNTADNVLDTVGGVGTVGECRQLCHDQEECGYITYYGQDSFPYRELCFLFRSCDETHPCDDCVSETRDCYDTCGHNMVGVIGDNLLGVISEVGTESECKKHCVAASECNFYTYFLEADPNSMTCVLLSSLISPVQPCETCVTGPVECGDSQDCHLVLNGEQKKSLMLTEPEVEVSNISMPLIFASCQLRVIVIGGGGKGDEEGGNGGGSGYIRYYPTDIFASEKQIKVTVGNSSQASIVFIDNGVLEAPPGDDGLSYPDDGSGPVGGDGYSGGGGYCVCSGGFDGGDGEAGGGDDGFVYGGGHGTGEKIALYKMDYFSLTPAAGGQGHEVGDFHGGGGGGVLVDGQGPACKGSGTYCSKHIGKGFGGGGCHFYDNSEDVANIEGSSGVVLIEV